MSPRKGPAFPRSPRFATTIAVAVPATPTTSSTSVLVNSEEQKKPAVALTHSGRNHCHSKKSKEGRREISSRNPKGKSINRSDIRSRSKGKSFAIYPPQVSQCYVLYIMCHAQCAMCNVLYSMWPELCAMYCVFCVSCVASARFLTYPYFTPVQLVKGRSVSPGPAAYTIPPIFPSSGVQPRQQQPPVVVFGCSVNKTSSPLHSHTSAPTTGTIPAPGVTLELPLDASAGYGAMPLQSSNWSQQQHPLPLDAITAPSFSFSASRRPALFPESATPGPQAYPKPVPRAEAETLSDNMRVLPPQPG